MEAYGGSAAASSEFDPIVFIKKPQVILRLVSWVFSIIVFGCIASDGYADGNCLYGGSLNACHFGIAVGVIAFLGCIFFLIIDYLFDQLSNVEYRKYAVIADISFSGLWTLMYFICFCYLTNKWANEPDKDVEEINISGIQAAIAFSFFSIITWAALTVLAVMRFRQGSQSAFAPSYEPDQTQESSPYSSFPGQDIPGSVESYQTPPFSEEKTPPTDTQYEPPTY